MLAESRFDSRICVLQERFRDLDKNNDNGLDFQELRELLKESRPDAKERELKWQFQELDKARRGKLDFGDFCDFVYKSDFAKRFAMKCRCTVSVTEGTSPEFDERDRTIKRQSLLTDDIIARRLNSPTASEAAGIDWEATSQTFYAYAGSDKRMQGNQFARLCRESRLFNDTFSAGHADYIFRRCCAKGESTLRKRAFRDALILIAHAKAEPATYVRALVCNAGNHQHASNDVKRRPHSISRSASATDILDGTCTTSTTPTRSTQLPRLHKSPTASSTSSSHLRQLCHSPSSPLDVIA